MFESSVKKNNERKEKPESFAYKNVSFNISQSTVDSLIREINALLKK